MATGLSGTLPAIAVGVLVATPGGLFVGGAVAHLVHRVAPTAATGCPRRARLLGATLGTAYPASVAACNVLVAGLFGAALLPELFAAPAAYAAVAAVAGVVFAAQYPRPEGRARATHRGFQLFAGGTYATLLCLAFFGLSVALSGVVPRVV